MAVSFLKKGSESAALAQKEAVIAQARKDGYGKLWRFYLKTGESAKITFVDGDLDKDGNLTPVRFYEHNLYMNQEWNNFFLCPEQSNPDSGEKCPICASGDSPKLVALFTVIDHRVAKSKKDPTKEFKDQKRLLAATPSTFEMFQKLAIKREGLAGVTFDVSRNNDKQSPSVGSLFDFDKKTPVEELKKLYTRSVTNPQTNVTSIETIFTVADYDAEITVRTGAELAKMGLGKPVAMVSSPAGSQGTTDYASQM